MRKLRALQLQALLESCETQPLLLDIRQAWEIDICKIENSVVIPMSQIHTKIDSLDTARETVTICHHGSRSVDQWEKTVSKQMATH